MEKPNRIAQTSISSSVGRQTPKNEFGDVLASTLGDVARVGGAVTAGITGGTPVLSAAVSAISRVASAPAVSPARTAPTPTLGSAGSALSAVSGGTHSNQASDNTSSLLQQQAELGERMIQMQIALQDESRQYNALSNIIKVRHDTAKAAINNIR